ncbi:hypothetical protein, partial [Synergistes jonesii]
MDNENIKNIPAFAGGKKLGMLFLPLMLAAAAFILIAAPAEEGSDKNVSLRTFEVPGFPMILVLEQEAGTINSA